MVAEAVGSVRDRQRSDPQGEWLWSDVQALGRNERQPQSDLSRFNRSDSPGNHLHQTLLAVAVKLRADVVWVSNDKIVENRPAEAGAAARMTVVGDLKQQVDLFAQIGGRIGDEQARRDGRFSGCAGLRDAEKSEEEKKSSGDNVEQ